jgi:kallikrein
MTDVFKCRKSGTQCCAPKSVIREVLDQRQPPPGPGGYAPDLSRNDTATYAPLTPIYPPYRPSPVDPQPGPASQPATSLRPLTPSVPVSSGTLYVLVDGQIG